jgi:hypothetical protein
MQDDIVYEFDVSKLVSLGFKITKENNYYVIYPPENYYHNGTLRNINKYISKVFLNIASFNLMDDISNEYEFVKKYGKPTIPFDFTNKEYNVSTKTLPQPSLNENNKQRLFDVMSKMNKPFKIIS